MSKEDNKEEAPEQEQSIWRSLGGTLLYLLVIVLLTWVIVTFVGQRTKVDGHSMEPTLSDGDNLIVSSVTASAIRKDMILLYSLTSMQRIPIISNVSSDCPVRLCR